MKPQTHRCWQNCSPTSYNANTDSYRWTVDDVLMWDHIGILHNALPDYGPDEPRITVAMR